MDYRGSQAPRALYTWRVALYLRENTSLFIFFHFAFAHKTFQFSINVMDIVGSKTKQVDQMIKGKGNSSV
ncbi:hypothetical protein PAHAL_5G405400 [Panicum hallii]|jgi:hypothetical protein|uniref:Uncharacterized protein n=1 Tax=Panicum hallii TaxID=206008 RepID=A0A2T8IMR4_9POAL|nr:hypothetical protein PAHAL_5G405400 [Panicum hallii]